MTTPFICLWFSQTDTDTEIYFTHFTNTDTPIFLGRISPQAHTAFLLSFLGPNVLTSPQLSFSFGPKLPQARMAYFVFLLCVASHTKQEPNPFAL